MIPHPTTLLVLRFEIYFGFSASYCVLLDVLTCRFILLKAAEGAAECRDAPGTVSGQSPNHRYRLNLFHQGRTSSYKGAKFAVQLEKPRRASTCRGGLGKSHKAYGREVRQAPASLRMLGRSPDCPRHQSRCDRFQVPRTLHGRCISLEEKRMKAGLQRHSRPLQLKTKR